MPLLVTSAAAANGNGSGALLAFDLDGPDGNLYCVAQDEVLAFDFETGECLGAVVRLPRLNWQAFVFFP